MSTLKPAPQMSISERWEHWKKHHPKEYREAIKLSPSIRKRAAAALREERRREKKIMTIRNMLEGGFTMKQIANSMKISRQALDMYYKKYSDRINKNLI